MNEITFLSIAKKKQFKQLQLHIKSMKKPKAVTKSACMWFRRINKKTNTYIIIAKTLKVSIHNYYHFIRIANNIKVIKLWFLKKPSTQYFFILFSSISKKIYYRKSIFIQKSFPFPQCCSSLFINQLKDPLLFWGLLMTCCTVLY